MASPARKSVELFYDVISPYTWIAFEQLLKYQEKWDMDLKLRPIFNAGVIQESGNQVPVAVPAKWKWIFTDLKLSGRYYNVPFKMPTDLETKLMKVGSLPAMRLLAALEMEKKESVVPMAREFWTRLWSRDQGIGPDSFPEVGRAVGLTDAEIESFCAKMKLPEVKNVITNNSKEAVERGAFGAPTMITTDDSGKTHLLFGTDRIPYLAMVLGKKYEGPLTD